MNLIRLQQKDIILYLGLSLDYNRKDEPWACGP